jgi:hypothetical protein
LPSFRVVAVAVALVLAVLAARTGGIRETVRAPITRAVVAALVTPWQAHASWTRGSPLPSTMLEPAAAVAGGKLYVFGGFVTSARAHEFPVTTRVAVYDPATDVWSRAADMPAAVTHANAVIVGDEVWFAGGFEGDDPGHAIADVRRYDTVTDHWNAGPPLPEPVAGGTLALVQDADGRRALHYVGGFAPDRDTVRDGHWRLVLATDEGGARVATDESNARWERRAPLPTPRGHLASAVVAGTLYALGGQRRHDTDPTDLDVVEAYDPRTNAWQSVASLPTPRSHFEAATFVRNGRVYVVGGRNNTTSLFIKGAGLADILVYDPTVARWTVLPGLPVGIESGVARPFDGRLVVTAGATFGDVVPQRETFIGVVP